MYTLALIFLGWFIAIAFGVSLLVALFKRRPLWRVWRLMAVSMFTIVVTLVDSARPISDDGPFYGRSRRDCPTRAPDHSYTVHDGYRLESFDAIPGDSAATVRLRTVRGQTKWCIYADADAGTHVISVRFNDYYHSLFGGVVVAGVVNWKYGHERSTWYLGPFGGLRDYWYSW